MAMPTMRPRDACVESISSRAGGVRVFRGLQHRARMDRNKIVLVWIKILQEVVSFGVQFVSPFGKRGEP